MQPKLTLTIENINLDMLELVMNTLAFPRSQVNFVLDNYQPDYKNLIEEFINKNINFKDLKDAIKK